MTKTISENGFKYFSVGSGKPIVILHGLMGGLSNFDGVFNYFPDQGYNVIAPELPIYSSNILNTNVKFFAEFVHKFIKFKKLKDVIILGNSLGGHVGLIFSKLYPKLVKGLVLKEKTMNILKKEPKLFFLAPRLLQKKLLMRYMKLLMTEKN